MNLTDIVGFVATVVGVSIMLPQLYKTYTTKHAQDLSWGMLTLFFLNCIFWLWYGLLLASPPLIFANSIGLVIISTLIALKKKYHRDV